MVNKNINPDDKSHVSTHCKIDKRTTRNFNAENNIHPGSVPPELSDLAQCEEMLIARAFPDIQVYARKGHISISYKGKVLNLPHNAQNVANILSQCPENPSAIAFAVKGRNYGDSFFKAIREKVNDALVYLKQNNPLYKKIIT